MDESETRRGRPSWFRVNNHGVLAINDGILLEQGIYVILKKYFRNEPYYVQVLEMFHDVSYSNLEFYAYVVSTLEITKYTIWCFRILKSSLQ